MLFHATNRCYAMCLAGVLMLLSLLGADNAQAAREVSAKRECATCHIMWLDDFKRDDVKTLIPYNPRPQLKTGKQDITSSERMCFSCHDGFVLDSRAVWKQGTHTHPVGIKPPQGMKISKINGKTTFPLNDDGKIYCGSCHTAHGVDWKSKDSPIFLRVKNIDSSLCLGCHQEKSTGPQHGNHPIRKLPPSKPTELIEAGAKFAKDGGVICQSCHMPHGGKQKFMLVKSNKKAALCYACHKNKRGVVDSKHDMTVMAPELKNSHGEDVTEMGPCSACHIPHGAKGPGLWARTIPVGQDKTAGMCLSCHNDKGPAKDKLVGMHSHPLNRAISKLGIRVDAKGWHSQHPWAQGKVAPVALPLFDKFGERTNKDGEISCPTCHDPHNWSTLATGQPHADPKKIDGDRNSSFLRIPQGDTSQLCQNCHVDKRPLLQSKHNIRLWQQSNETKAKTNNPAPVIAIDKDTCGFCHAVHNAKGDPLWARGQGQGSMAIETLCKDCHQKTGLAKDKVLADVSHPLGRHPEHMQHDRRLPLFDRNGNRIEHNGLVDCATCHNPHQWTPQIPQPGLTVTLDQEGDASNSFLRVSAAGDAMLCATCHQDKALVRGTDHDLRVTAKEAHNAAMQSVQQSGICGQCHAVHNPQMAVSLWARKPGEGEDLKEQQCRSCHQDGGIASNKVPPALHHPHKVMVWSNVTRQQVYSQAIPDTPVFGKDGKPAHVGFLSCPSCHNPHQWNPRQAVTGPGKNVEGDALTSFLRNADSEYIVCGDCHGQDGLFRYKYFHAKASRKPYPLYR
jgi:predicted CXXCH cytochrome family protein